MGQGVHAGGGSEGRGHGGHHVRIYHGDLGDVVGVHTDELALFLHIGDDVVDGDLSGSAGGGGDGDGKDSVTLRGGDPFQGADVGEFRVVDDDADGFGGIHDGTAAYGDDAVRLGVLEGFDAVLDVFNGGVGLDVGEKSGIYARFFQRIQNLVDLTALDYMLAGAD